MTASTYSGCGYTVPPSFGPTVTAARSASVPLRQPFPVDPFQSLAIGVGTICTARCCASVSPNPLLPYFSLYLARRSKSRPTSLTGVCEAVGVGTVAEQPHPLAPVTSAKATGPESEGDNKVAKALQLGPHSMPGPKSVGPVRVRILAENKRRPKLRNNADEFAAEVVVLPLVDAAGVAVALAGVAPGDEVNPPVGGDGSGGGKGSDVIVPLHVGPVPLQHLPTVGVNLHLPGAGPPGPLQAQLQPADAGEQATKRRPAVHVAALPFSTSLAAAPDLNPFRLNAQKVPDQPHQQAPDQGQADLHRPAVVTHRATPPRTAPRSAAGRTAAGRSAGAAS